MSYVGNRLRAADGFDQLYTLAWMTTHLRERCGCGIARYIRDHAWLLQAYTAAWLLQAYTAVFTPRHCGTKQTHTFSSLDADSDR